VHTGDRRALVQITEKEKKREFKLLETHASVLLQLALERLQRQKHKVAAGKLGTIQLHARDATDAIG
jgi:hypothetical protein